MLKVVFLAALVVALCGTVHAQGEVSEVSEPKPIGRCPNVDIPNKPPRFLPDANNCRLYYECSKGGMIQRECPEGQCFTRKAKGCE